MMLFAVKNLNIYHTNPSDHSMNTRQQNKLHITSVRLFSVLRGVYCSAVKIFNQVPQTILKYCNIIHNHKILLGVYLVNNAFYCTEEFLPAGHNDVDIWTFILTLFDYCVCWCVCVWFMFVIYHVLINVM
jgi:hypothetical protein